MPFKTILGALIELEPKAKAEVKGKEISAKASGPGAAAVASLGTATATGVAVAIATPSQVQQTSYGSIDPKMLEMLDNAMAEANQPGFDYFEFQQALSNLSMLPEPQRFQAVFTTAKSMGVTQQSLSASVDHYQKVLQRERESFLHHVENKKNQEVVSRQNKRVTNDGIITDAQQKIIELQKQISDLQQENIKLDTEIAQENLQINNTSNAFESTYNAVLKRLEEDKLKIQTHLSQGV